MSIGNPIVCSPADIHTPILCIIEIGRNKNNFWAHFDDCAPDATF